MSDFEQYGAMTAFALDAVHKSLTKIRALAGGGTETVETREGEYKAWDPEVFKVDKESENNFVACVEAAGLNAVILSEELKRKEMPGKGDLVYVISDPFDGSLLYKRQIPAFWYTSLAVFDKNGSPLTAVVGDCAANSADFATEDRAYTGRFAEGNLVGVHEIGPSNVTELKDAFLESYLMKPKFLYPTVIKYQPLLSKMKFILPNGGPAGFTDVAAGRVDVYFAVGQPYIEIFSGCAVAQRAGCVISTFDGQPVRFEDNIDGCYDVLCSANQELHDKVLEELSKIQ